MHFVVHGRMGSGSVRAAALRASAGGHPAWAFVDRSKTISAMGKFIKAGRVVVLLQGRYTGKKAIVVKPFDDGSRARPFGHCLVAGVDKAPLKVTKTMGKKKIAKRTRVKPFVKYVNYNHMMPTRYQVPAEVGVQSWVTDQQMDNPDGRVEAKKLIKNAFQEKFASPPADKAGKPSKDVLYLRKKLRF
ncbi:unnamed protein product [Prorocentrum cordatum]|uniref:60S ribosomal protein L27 n=2 Tax=Prorocentrum cordatum TaxID=2364126 RepID=A0ABN9UMC8_9DINO|nr:unnamed protein product [Polarella glacialis]